MSQAPPGATCRPAGTEDRPESPDLLYARARNAKAEQKGHDHENDDDSINKNKILVSIHILR